MTATDNYCLIRRVREEFGALSNMSPHEVSFGDEVWPRAEHLFQALRFSRYHPIRGLLRLTPNPMAAKMLVKPLLEDATVTPRSAEDLANMRLVLQLKLAQHADVKTLLKSTGSRLIVEDCTARPSASGLFWGAANQGGQWHGENWLGRLWMELREQEVTE